MLLLEHTLYNTIALLDLNLDPPRGIDHSRWLPPQIGRQWHSQSNESTFFVHFVVLPHQTCDRSEALCERLSRLCLSSLLDTVLYPDPLVNSRLSKIGPVGQRSYMQKNVSNQVCGFSKLTFTMPHCHVAQTYFLPAWQLVYRNQPTMISKARYMPLGMARPVLTAGHSGIICYSPIDSINGD